MNGAIFSCNFPTGMPPADPDAACYQEQCELTPQCRWIPPIDTDGVGGICEGLDECGSVCSACDSLSGCNTAPTCEWIDDGDNIFDPSECIGSKCSTNCEQCINETRCLAAEVQEILPERCIWTGTQCMEPTPSPTMEPTFEPTTGVPTEVTPDPTSDPTTEPTIDVADTQEDEVDGEGDGDDPEEIDDDGLDGASDDSPAGFTVRDDSSVSESRSESESSSNDNGIFFRRNDDGNDVAFLDDMEGNTYPDNDLEFHVDLSPRAWSVVWGFIVCCILSVCLYSNIHCKFCDKKQGIENRVFECDVSMPNDV